MPKSRNLKELIEEQRRTAPASPAPPVGAGNTFASSQSGAAPLPSAQPAQSGGGASEIPAKLEKIKGLAALLCWVAAEYYPRGSLDWRRCREWVLRHPRLTNLYVEHGPTLAGFLRCHPVSRWLFTPIVLFARWRGQP